MTQIGLYSNNFAEVFSKLLQKSCVTRYQISDYAHIDQAYLMRLMRGERTNPSPETIVKIAIALVHFSDKVELNDIECLLNSVGRSLRIKN